MDANNVEVGVLASTHLVGMTVGTDLVFAWLDAMNRTFTPAEPVYYYATANCTGAPLMYVDLFRMGYVSNNTLYYPAGAATTQAYGSWREGTGFCSASAGVAAFAPVGTTSVSGFQAPFTIVK